MLQPRAPLHAAACSEHPVAPASPHGHEDPARGRSGGTRGSARSIGAGGQGAEAMGALSLLSVRPCSRAGPGQGDAGSAAAAAGGGAGAAASAAGAAGAVRGPAEPAPGQPVRDAGLMAFRDPSQLPAYQGGINHPAPGQSHCRTALTTRLSANHTVDNIPHPVLGQSHSGRALTTPAPSKSHRGRVLTTRLPANRHCLLTPPHPIMQPTSDSSPPCSPAPSLSPTHSPPRYVLPLPPTPAPGGGSWGPWGRCTG